MSACNCVFVCSCVSLPAYPSVSRCIHRSRSVIITLTSISFPSQHSVARRQTFAVEAAPPQDTQTRFVLVPYQSTAQPVTPAASYSALPLLPRQPDIQTTALAPIMPVSLPLVPRQPDIQTGMVSGGKWVYVPEAQPAGVSRQTQAVFSPHLQGGVSSGGRVLYY